ncbi:transposase [Streptacidiphilus sp. EB129]|uniref:transposase n=1 Tax=Streptacidiphilus sp. EB129 TaxID=3156262 RepID=UPI0035154B8C
MYRASPGRTYASVAKDLGVNHETLRVWAREAEQAAVPGTAEATALSARPRPAPCSATRPARRPPRR